VLPQMGSTPDTKYSWPTPSVSRCCGTPNAGPRRAARVRAARHVRRALRRDRSHREPLGAHGTAARQPRTPPGARSSPASGRRCWYCGWWWSPRDRHGPQQVRSRRRLRSCPRSRQDHPVARKRADGVADRVRLGLERGSELEHERVDAQDRAPSAWSGRRGKLTPRSRQDRALCRPRLLRPIRRATAR